LPFTLRQLRLVEVRLVVVHEDGVVNGANVIVAQVWRIRALQDLNKNWAVRSLHPGRSSLGSELVALDSFPITTLRFLAKAFLIPAHQADSARGETNYGVKADTRQISTSTISPVF
jgi:hypothetical protein